MEGLSQHLCTGHLCSGLPPFGIRMLQIATTNVILQINGAAGAVEETINCIVQGLFINASPDSPFPSQLTVDRSPSLHYWGIMGMINLTVL